MNANEVART